MKRIEECGKSELFISCSKVKMVLFEEFAFALERAIEQPIQCLYPLKLNCDVNPVKSNTNIAETKLNIKAKEFRAKRNLAVIAKLKIQEDIINKENSE